MSFIVQKNQIKRLKRLLLVALGIYIMIGTSLYFLQEKLLFLPIKLTQDFNYEFTQSFEELFLYPEKDVKINAIHFKAPNSKGVVLYFHGNAGNLDRWGKITENLVNWDFDVFVIDYRTYGKSIGKLSEEALYNDAQYCYDYLKKSYEEKNIIIYGRSLGTGIASYLAHKNNPKKVFLEAPYFSIADVARRRFPIFPVSMLLKYKLPTNQYLKEVNCPIILIHGMADKVVPFKSGKKLVEMRLPNLNFVPIEEGGHNNLVEFEDYEKALNIWLN